jgi:hypothetical protein
VQAQTLSFSVQNNSTLLQTVTNAFAFTGLVLDVVAAFLGLQFSTLLESELKLMDRLLDDISEYTPEQLAEVIDAFSKIGRRSPTDPGMTAVIRELRKRAEKLIPVQRAEAETYPSRGDGQGCQSHSLDCVELRGLPQVVAGITTNLHWMTYLGTTVRITMVLGILCFFLSVVCLAKATQPLVIWIATIIASSCVIALPLFSQTFALLRASATRRPAWMSAL